MTWALGQLTHTRFIGAKQHGRLTGKHFKSALITLTLSAQSFLLCMQMNLRVHQRPLLAVAIITGPQNVL